MILRVKGLTKSYGTHPVLTNCSFEIPDAQIVALVGPNGAGKSTLMNCLMNLIPFEKGEIEILGMQNKNPNIFHRVSYMKDNRVLYPYLSGYDHLRYLCHLQKVEEKRVDELADRLGLHPYLTKKTANYSLGMKQHLLLAMALVNHPKFILMDEPLNGLDPDSIIQVRHFLQELYQEGTTILLSSHTLSEIDRMTSHILFLQGGQILEEDISQYQKLEYEVGVASSQKKKFWEKLRQSPWAPKVRQERDYFSITVKEKEIRPFLQFLCKTEIPLSHFQTKQLSAESRYQELFHPTENTVN